MAASEQSLKETSLESQNFMKQAITDLSERLKVLERQAKQKKEELQERDRSWGAYKVFFKVKIILGLFDVIK